MAYPVDNLPPIHPGELLADDLEALEMSASKFAKHLGKPTNAITRIIKGQCSVSPEMAILLGRALGTTEQYWMNLQRNYDVKIARKTMAKRAARIRPLVKGKALHAA
jgi:antitoxin HigA-1